VAKIQFPKYAAGATLERDGKMLYFIDEQTRDEFVKRSNTRTQQLASRPR
jgi:hypothetical protein